MRLNLTWTDFISIRTNILWYDLDLLSPERSSKLRLYLGDLMLERGEWKKLSEIIPGRTPVNVESQIRDLELQGYYFGDRTVTVDDELCGVNFDQPILVTYTEQKFFRILFPYRLAQLAKENRKWVNDINPQERMDMFLSYHFHFSFGSNRADYRKFILSILASSDEVIGHIAEYVRNWLTDLETLSESQPLTGITYTQDQIALSIIYRQLAGTLDYWAPGMKEKGIQEVARDFGKSWNKLMQSYNKLSKNGAERDRLQVIGKEGNKARILELLGSDQKAITALRLELDKKANP